MEQNIRISDAIPEMPASFDKRVEDTLHTVCAGRALRAADSRPIRWNRKAWIAIAVAATLLITTTAVAAAAILSRERFSPNEYMIQPPEERQSVPDVDNAIASAKPEPGDFSIAMLPELEDAEHLNEWRQKKGQPVYSEADWGWIREIRPEVQEVLLDGTNLIFNIRLHTDHGESFSWDPSLPQIVDALCDTAWYSFTPDGERHTLGGLGTGVTPTTVNASGATLYTECDLDALDEPFPTDGPVWITAVINVDDCRVDTMSSIGVLGKITCTFRFDASAGADVADPVVAERALSGVSTLTYTDSKGRAYNKSVSLDGVVLEETIRYRSTGIYLTYRIKSAPDGWTDRDTDALMWPNKGCGYGLSIVCASTGGDEQAILNPGYPNSIPDGEYICILPIFPSDYAQVKETGCELRLGLRYIDTFNGVPVGDGWQMPEDAGGADDQIGFREQPIGVYSLPIP